jgi:hypothetical protein
MTPQELQELVNSYKAALEQQQITKEEYIALIYGINVMEGISDDADGLIQKEQLNTILNAAINAASLMV